MLDAAILLAFVGYSVWAGLRARRAASADLESYFLAGRTLRGWKAGTSMAATQFAADTPLLVMGLVATAGVFALWRLWIYGLAFLLLAFVFSGMWRRAGVITDAELTELRYGGEGALWLRGFKSIYYGVVFNCAVLAMVLKATLIFTEALLPWHEWLPGWAWSPVASLIAASGAVVASGVTGLAPDVATVNNFISIILIFTFTTFYSLTGGLRGVVRTDIAQFALAIIGTIGLAWVVAAEAGGLWSIPRRLSEMYGAEAARAMLSWAPAGGAAEAALAPLVIVVVLQWLFQMNSDGTGYLAQRAMACRNAAEARIAGVTFAWLQILLRTLPWLVIAAGLLLVYPVEGLLGDPGLAADREATFVFAVRDLLPIGLYGIMLTALLAALASTLDSHLNWGASYFTNDLYKRILCERLIEREPKRRELVLVARLSNILIVLLALAILPLVESIQAAWHITLTLGAGVGLVLALRWVWERINLWSELAAIGASLVVAPVLLWLSQWAGGVEAPEELSPLARAGWTLGSSSEAQLLAVAVISTTVVLATALLTAPTRPDRLDAFYTRVRPMGFWRATAARIDPGRRPGDELARALGVMILCAASLYLCLYGCGRLLLPPVDGARWPAAAALLAGVGLIPVWWTLGIRRAPRDTGPQADQSEAPLR